tara:strand:+ start:1414 stop:1770 length:357 start_codon:yes stop_codon:yes gene_type:complete
MAKPRELTEVEKFYIQNNLQESDSKIASLMSGVGVKTVAKYRESLTDTQQDKQETEEERIHRLGNGPKSGTFIQSNENGTTVMTQQASEVSDAKKVVKGLDYGVEESAKRAQIHRPKS